MHYALHDCVPTVHVLYLLYMYMYTYIIFTPPPPSSPEHLGLALALSVPVFVVVTKIDMCPANVLQDTMKLLNRVLKSPGCRKIPVMVQCHDDVITSAVNFTSERYCIHLYFVHDIVFFVKKTFSIAYYVLYMSDFGPAS